MLSGLRTWTQCWMTTRSYVWWVAKLYSSQTLPTWYSSLWTLQSPPQLRYSAIKYSFRQKYFCRLLSYWFASCKSMSNRFTDLLKHIWQIAKLIIAIQCSIRMIASSNRCVSRLNQWFRELHKRLFSLIICNQNTIKCCPMSIAEYSTLPRYRDAVWSTWSLTYSAGNQSWNPGWTPFRRQSLLKTGPCWRTCSRDTVHVSSTSSGRVVSLKTRQLAMLISFTVVWTWWIVSSVL